MSKALDRSASEAQIIDADDGDRQEIAAIRQQETPMSKPQRVSADEVEFTADLGSVMTSGDVVVSDVPAASDDYREYHVEMTATGSGVAVPDDDAPSGPVAVDRAAEDFQSATAPPERDDAAENDQRRQESTDSRRRLRESELKAELAAAQRDLKLAEATAKADDLARRLR